MGASYKSKIKDLLALQSATSEQPYSIFHRIDLAKAYQSLGYPDLAAGDAYKALLLIDELVQEGEYHDEALEAAKEDSLSRDFDGMTINDVETKSSDGSNHLLEWTSTICYPRAYELLINSLIDCGNLRSASEYISRAKKRFPHNIAFELCDASLSSKLQAWCTAHGKLSNDVDIEDYPDRGMVRRENYPWNTHEPDRFTEDCLQFLNDEMASVAPKLEVRICELPLLTTHASIPSSSETIYVKQLGVFAKQEIPPGEQLLTEKSMLTAIARLHDAYCDACSLSLPKDREATLGARTNEVQSCEECEEVFFCSAECHDMAQDKYHPSVCGIDVDQAKVPAGEASADSLYTSLSIRALALAATQGLHPLDLPELRYIWGDYHGLDLDKIWSEDTSGQAVDAFRSVPQTLPFSFKSTVLTSLHILEKMDVNIFTHSDRYDTWVINTIYAKLRGTASARQGLDGRPEIGAVHPMWCLANHSCDPNVAWDWQGTMRLWSREELVNWDGRGPDAKPGVREGAEILSHYCDVRLPVNERREWAAGALGGDCVCRRCSWEAAQAPHADSN
ncbi:hypothetical protein FB567DRAFT_533417 [Paraphoma chrysanthemicola]|uniref:SET domain-containing protein n=1 Tax=Paraphoma chrysanthemicola TaxID=798071 RepID=A0A8K0R0F6_9PLEO|nr:hypothetical protein FB567DRAFT_533417 [Paraphoma chrysanthemicola]